MMAQCWVSPAFFLLYWGRERNGLVDIRINVVLCNRELPKSWSCFNLSRIRVLYGSRTLSIRGKLQLHPDFGSSQLQKPHTVVPHPWICP